MLDVLRRMGLFTKSPKLKPKITVAGIEATFDPEYKWWEFTYRDHDFITFDSHMVLPSLDQLDQIIETVSALKPAMIGRISDGWKERGDIRVGESELSYSIDLGQFSKGGSFEVSWSGGVEWGDMGVDFTIEGGVIDDESWGD